MKKQDVVVIVCVGLVTMVVATAALKLMPWATAVETKPAVSPPTLEVDGVLLTLVTAQATYGAGEMPVVVLKAENTRNEPATLKVNVLMSQMSLANMWSRSAVPSIRPPWSHVCDVDLSPKETRTFEIKTQVVRAGSQVAFVVEASGKRMTALDLAIVAPKPAEPAKAAAREPAVQSKVNG